MTHLRVSILFAVVCVALVADARAATFTLFKDINAGSGSSEIGDMWDYSGYLGAFSASTPEKGLEYFSLPGAVRIQNLRPGSEDGAIAGGPGLLFKTNGFNYLLVVARDGNSEYAPWLTKGNTFIEASGAANPHDFAQLDTNIMFLGENASNNEALYLLDNVDLAAKTIGVSDNLNPVATAARSGRVGRTVTEQTPKQGNGVPLQRRDGRNPVATHGHQRRRSRHRLWRDGCIGRQDVFRWRVGRDRL